MLLELEVLAVPVPQEFRFWAGVGRWKKEEGRRKREEGIMKKEGRRNKERRMKEE